MAKHLLDRLGAALRPNARIGDCRGVLADGDEELRNIDERIAEAEARSIDPSVSDDAARKGRDEAEDFRLYKRRLTRGLEDLRAVIAQKEEAQRSEERVTAYANVKAARDALVERWLSFRDDYHRMLQLLEDTWLNDRALAASNCMLPEGGARLLSAELVARGAGEARFPSGDPVYRFTEMDWDPFTSPGRIWSLYERERREIAEHANREGARSAAVAAAREAANTPQALAAKAEAEAARYSRYSVAQARYCGTMLKGVRHRDGASGVDSEAVTLWMDPDQVHAAEKRGLTRIIHERGYFWLANVA